jgi:hypothetical protein
VISCGKLTVAALAVGAAIGAFLATPRLGGDGGQGPPLARWLGLSAEQTQAVEKADPSFEDDADRLTTALRAEREKLAALLDDPKSADDRVMEQVERVIDAHNGLERRVATHVLAIRPSLTVGQQKRLMGLCASGVRRAAGRQWQRGRGLGRGTGRGRGGPGSGVGPGRGGRGRGGRGRGGPAD